MKQFLSRLWHETDGVLSFEWTMLTTLLTVGVVSGVAAVRDAVTDEMGDVAQAMVSLDQSYVIQPPLTINVHTLDGFGGFTNGFLGTGFGVTSAASDSVFIDASSYQDCGRAKMKVIEFPRKSQQQPQPATPPMGEEEVQPAI